MEIEEATAIEFLLETSAKTTDCITHVEGGKALRAQQGKQDLAVWAPLQELQRRQQNEARMNQFALKIESFL